MTTSSCTQAELVQACTALVEADALCQQAMLDGVNVHGALSAYIGAEANLRACLGVPAGEPSEA